MLQESHIRLNKYLKDVVEFSEPLAAEILARSVIITYYPYCPEKTYYTLEIHHMDVDEVILDKYSRIRQYK